MTSVIVISPETDDPRESAIVPELFAAGLERYHVRKPGWSRVQLESFLTQFPSEVRRRMCVHSHHELAAPLGLGGVHWRDQSGTGVSPVISRTSGHDAPVPFTSRSCHDLATLRGSLGQFDSVFFGPVFPSISKQGYGPTGDFPWAALSALLATRTTTEGHTSILALGGITAETAPRALALGFDGVAVLGAVWQSPDPVRAFQQISTQVAPVSDRRLASQRLAPRPPRSIESRERASAAAATSESVVASLTTRSAVGPAAS